MRKRKYGHRSNSVRIDDVLVEEIDAFFEGRERGETDMPQANIHNLVGTAMISCSVKPLNLQYITRLLPNATFDKQKFAAITIRLREPPCTTLLFTSGKMVLTGCRDFMECVLASHEIVSFLRRGVRSFQFKLVHVCIQNIVGNVTVALKDQVIDLDRIYREHNVYCTYQKQMFPGKRVDMCICVCELTWAMAGLIYRPNACPVVLLIFISGKIVITGGKSSHDVHDGWKQLWPFVRQYITSGPAA